MSRTQITGLQVLDHSVQKDDLDTTTSGQAVITKVLAGSNVNIQSTGIDVGTGEVTINVTSSGIDEAHLLAHQKLQTLIWMT